MAQLQLKIVFTLFYYKIDASSVSSRTPPEDPIEKFRRSLDLSRSTGASSTGRAAEIAQRECAALAANVGATTGEILNEERAILRDEVNALREARARDAAASTRSLSALERRVDEVVASLSARQIGNGIVAARVDLADGIDALRQDLALMKRN